MSFIGDPEIFHIKGIAVNANVFTEVAVRGCQVGECNAFCCSHGVSISVTQAEDILAHQAEILPQLPPERHDPQTWFDWQYETEEDHPDGGMLMRTAYFSDPTHPTGTRCVFSLPDSRCGLQAAGMATGQHPWRFKPFYCALHPLTFSKGVLCLATENAMYLQGGTCMRPTGQTIPIYRLCAAEIKLVLGEDGYLELEREAARRDVK
jgi:hypothetical protein